MLTTLAIAHYRSLHTLVVPMARLNLVTGANGSGKSSLYRALRLLAETAQGGVVPALAREGGLGSTLWAGPETLSAAMRRGEVAVEGGPRQKPVSLKLGFAGEDFGYAIDLGLPTPSQSVFGLDPEIKREVIWSGPFLRQGNTLVDRRAAHAASAAADGAQRARDQPASGSAAGAGAFDCRRISAHPGLGGLARDAADRRAGTDA